MKHQHPMRRRFFEACTPPEYGIKNGDRFQSPFIPHILSGEPIPDELLLSRARFRFSPMQNSITSTIFTTCQKRQPYTIGHGGDG